MALDTENELVQFVKDMMGASYEKVSDDGFKHAVTQAQAELQWSVPLSNSFQEYWMVERTKRFVTYILLFESAHKFQYKKISLQHRFKHYKDLLEIMDTEFLRAIEDNPENFDTSTGTVLCFYLTNGFQYDSDGTDLTYSEGSNGWPA